MGTIHLALSGNAFHSDTPEDKWHVLDSEQLGLQVIGGDGIPASVSFQGIDFEIFPWLRGTLAHYPSLECTSAPYGHGLIPLLHPVQQSWEIEHRPITHRMMFFPEFYTPEECFIPDMFFVLGPHTITYTPYGEKESIPLSFLAAGKDPENFTAIQYGSKVGLVMRGFDILLSRYFAFQRNPYSLRQSPSPLYQLLKEIERIAKEVPYTVIMPLDIEAPYIGSFYGAKIWETFICALKRSGLDEIFISLESVIQNVRRTEMITTDRPHRELTPKWFGYEMQFAYYAFIRRFRPKDEREHFLLSLAGASDVLSSLYRRVTALKARKRSVFSAIDLAGQEKRVCICADNSVLDLCQSAWLALKKDLSLVDAINKSCDRQSLIVKRTLFWAEVHGL